jgi:hypothetical protein
VSGAAAAVLCLHGLLLVLTAGNRPGCDNAQAAVLCCLSWQSDRSGIMARMCALEAAAVACMVHPTVWQGRICCTCCWSQQTTTLMDRRCRRMWNLFNKIEVQIKYRYRRAQSLVGQSCCYSRTNCAPKDPGRNRADDGIKVYVSL